MKPYKIIKPKQPIHKRTVLISRLSPKRVPLWFFKNVHTPPKAKIVTVSEADPQQDPSCASQREDL